MCPEVPGRRLEGLETKDPETRERFLQEPTDRAVLLLKGQPSLPPPPRIRSHETLILSQALAAPGPQPDDDFQPRQQQHWVPGKLETPGQQPSSAALWPRPRQVI